MKQPVFELRAYAGIRRIPTSSVRVYADTEHIPSVVAHTKIRKVCNIWRKHRNSQRILFTSSDLESRPREWTNQMRSESEMSNRNYLNVTGRDTTHCKLHSITCKLYYIVLWITKQVNNHEINFSKSVNNAVVVRTKPSSHQIGKFICSKGATDWIFTQFSCNILFSLFL
jgi:hypothetical protein